MALQCALMLAALGGVVGAAIGQVGLGPRRERVTQGLDWELPAETAGEPVLVIGAGAAGLAAARRLRAAGRPVTLLEALSRIGGRIHTDDGFASVPVELGAEFIHGRQASTWQIVRAAGLHTVQVDHRATVEYHLDGRRLGWPDLAGDPELRQTGRLEEHLAGYQGPDITFREYARAQDWSPRARARAEAFIAGYDAADPGEISVLARAEQARRWHAGVGNFRILEGYARVVEALAAGLDVRLNTQVSTVRWQAGAVVVETRDGQRFEAARAVVTLPLGVLQAGGVAFDPPLPPAKQTAIARLRMGPVVKIILRFREPFWGRRLGFLLSDRPVPTWWAPGLGQPGYAPVLTGWAGGPPAAALSRLGAESAIAQALDDLTHFFGPAPRRLFETARFVDWPSDPFARGGYSYVPVGAMGAQAALAEPVDGTLFFAGEATHTAGHIATVHGAIESGWRAAAELLGGED